MVTAERRTFTHEGEEYERVPADELPEGDLEADTSPDEPVEDAAEEPVGSEPRTATPRSQNGYSANDRSVIATYTVPGTSTRFALRKGDVAYLLCHFAAWHDKHVESIDGGQLDDWGYAERTVRGSSSTLSNHASGTAIDINALKHPMGKRNTYPLAQRTLIQRELERTYEGVIRAGMTYTRRPDDMHYEVNAGPTAVARVVAKLRAAAERDPLPPPKPPKPKPPTPPTPPAGDRHLRYMHPPMEGQDVANVINALQAAGYDLPDGRVYTQEVGRAVNEFNDEHDIEGRGVVPETWAALRRIIHG